MAQTEGLARLQTAAGIFEGRAAAFIVIFVTILITDGVQGENVRK